MLKPLTAQCNLQVLLTTVLVTTDSIFVQLHQLIVEFPIFYIIDHLPLDVLYFGSLIQGNGEIDNDVTLY